jgi:succinate dehydrogenase/fumarate reductase flavoprotein subunit
MSWAHLPQDILDFLPQWYGKPLLRGNWHWEGFDFKDLVARIKQGYAVEVAPAAHFMMGGVHIDERCETALHGLFACGEVAGGVHGANRLSGNACTQFLVQGRVAGRAAAEAARAGGPVVGPQALRALATPEPKKSGSNADAYALLEKAQSIANAGLNVVRSSDDLNAARDAIRSVVEEAQNSCANLVFDSSYNRRIIDTLEARSAAMTVEAMVLSAIERQESRGAHYRDDFPEPDDRYLHHGIITMQRGALNYSTMAING